MSTMDLQDKKALITGGTSGMGSAAALAMAEKGASDVPVSRCGDAQDDPQLNSSPQLHRYFGVGVELVHQ